MKTFVLTVPILTVLMVLSSPVNAQAILVWGDDTRDQVSNAPDGEFKAIAGGSIQGLALRSNGTPVLWGGYIPGALGAPPIPDSLAAQHFAGVTLGRDDAVLIREDGTLAAFGRNDPVVSFLPAGTYSEVAVAASHAIALATDGTLSVWGSDSAGPVSGLLNAPEDGHFSAVAARVWYSLALDTNGTLFGWRGEPDGVIIFNAPPWEPTPDDPANYYIPTETFTAIAAGNEHALAIRADGTITGWGSAWTSALDAPTHVTFKAVSAGWDFSIGLTTEGELWGWGTPETHPIINNHRWTFASEGWSQYSDSQHYYVPVKRFRSIAAGAFNVMAIVDPDDDGDGIPNDNDFCDGYVFGDLVDRNGCSAEQAADLVVNRIYVLIDSAVSDNARAKLYKAQDKLNDALAELNEGDVKNALKKIGDAVKELAKAGDDGADVAELIAQLVESARAQAQAAINAAQARCDAELDPEEKADCHYRVDKANDAMANAREELDDGKPDKAIDHYAKAWYYAT